MAACDRGAACIADDHLWPYDRTTGRRLGFAGRHACAIANWENAFIWIEDLAGAQKFSDRFCSLDWPRLLRRKIRPDFEGEIVSDVCALSFKRIPGARIKHRGTELAQDVRQGWFDPPIGDGHQQTRGITIATGQRIFTETTLEGAESPAELVARTR